MINKNIFRAYDIRGKAMGENISLDNQTAYLIGKASGTYLVRNGHKNFVLGRDGRLTSPDLHKNFLKGVLESGINVFDVGLATSPYIYFASCLEQFDCACNITASHNPKDDNGFKFVSSNAHSIFGDELQTMYQMIVDEDFDETENLGEYNEIDLFSEYLNKLHSMVEIKRKIKVVVDTGNGVAGEFAKRVFDLQNVEAEFIFLDVDGNFPNHVANPEKAEYLEDLSKKVVELNADLGIGFDGDGDRVGFIDENGKHYSLDLILMLFARDALSRNPNRPIIFDAKCSKVVENDIIQHGGIPMRTKTGHSHIENALHKNNGIFAGEMSGHMFFNENYYGFDDAFLGALKMIEILSNSNKPFSAFFDGLPEIFNTPEIRLETKDEIKFDIVERVSESLKAEGIKVNNVDGVFAEFDDVSWFAIRASNTAAQLTIRFEAQDQEMLDKLIKKLYAMLESEDDLELAPLKKFIKA